MSPGFFEVLPGEVVPFGACEESGSVFGNFLLFLCRAKSVSLRESSERGKSIWNCRNARKCRWPNLISLSARKSELK